MTIWFTADLHLGHANIIKYCNRPFNNVREMDNEIIKNFQTILKSGDTLFILGDLTWDENIARRFFTTFPDIKIHLILGNHDLEKIAEYYCKSINKLATFNINNQTIVMCHFPMLTWDGSFGGSWLLYGHEHGRVQHFIEKTGILAFDVGVDTNHFMPVSFENLSKYMNSMKRIHKDNDMTFEKKVKIV